MVISKNQFINREKALAQTLRGGIRAELGSGLWVEGNKWATGNGITPPSLLYDAETTKDVVCKDNVLGN
jgi:hypothetical protein